MSENKQQKTAPPLLHKNIGHQDLLTLDRLNREREDSHDQVAALNNELGQRFTEIAILTRLLLEKEQQFEALQSLRDTLTTALESKIHAYDDLLSLMTIRDTNIESLSLQLGQAEGELGSRDAEIARLKSELYSIYGSTSWRVTAPLRHIKKLGFIAR